MQAAAGTNPQLRTVDGEIKLHMNDKARRSKFHYVAKLAQTILLSPVTTTAKLTYRAVKLLVWVAPKAGLYTLLGYHTESATFFERGYLKTVKALRDILFIPALAKRACEDIVAKQEEHVDDIKSKSPENYLEVGHDQKLHQYTSYLHGCETFEVFYPQGITEFEARSDGQLKTVMASHFLKPNMMAINFGVPNVSTFITKKEDDGSVQTVQVDAKSLRRADMTYHPTNGRIQSGIFLVPTNLPEEALGRFNQAAEDMANEKRRDITCVNTNCRVLKAAGFSIEGVDMESIIFPSALIEHLLFRNVFFTDSKGQKHKIHFDILNTTKQSLEDHFENIDMAVVGTRLRHRRRAADTEEKMEARGIAAKLLIEQEKQRLSQACVPQRVEGGDLERRKITVSVPSFLGDLFSRKLGRHTMYEVDLSDKKQEILEAFQAQARNENGPLKLQPFPQEKPSLFTRLKRDIFFSGPVIGFLRRHLMGREDTIHLYTQDLFGYLKSTQGKHLNYVVLEDRIVLAITQVNEDREGAHRKVADWALSKHALLAGRQPVYCSGEIWYDKDKDRFMLNNDSGTYTPSLDRVGVVVYLANEIFGAQRFGNVFEVAQPNN